MAPAVAPLRRFPSAGRREVATLRAVVDRERRLTYLAEELAQEQLLDGLDDDAYDLDPVEAEAFVVATAAAAGWAKASFDAGGGITWAATVVPVVFDVPDEHDLAGWVDDTGTIHLHPRLCNRWTVLHELAHALDRRDGHTATFRGRLAKLIDVGIGTDAGGVLRFHYGERGLEVDDSKVR